MDISPDAINAFYQLQTTGEDQYTAFTRSEFNTEEVIVEMIGKPRNLMPNWVNILKEWLTPKARMVNLWMSTRLFPAILHSLVSNRRALLLYAMSKDLTINVGQVIRTKMRAMMNPMKKNQSIGFPR